MCLTLMHGRPGTRYLTAVSATTSTERPLTMNNDVSPTTQCPVGARANTLTVAELDSDTDEVFAALRAEDPVAWVPALQSWVASSWSICREIATNADDFPGGTNAMEARLFGSPLILGAEGETHTDLRSAVSNQLKPRAFRSGLETRIRPMAREHAAKIADRNAVELMHDYFEPVSVLSVADALGMPNLSSDTLQRWFHTLAGGATNVTGPDGNFLDPHGFDEPDKIREEVRTHLTQLREEEQRNPSDGPVANLFRAGLPEGEMRDVEYLLPTVLVLFLGGLQEPGHACGVTFLGLSTRPEQLHRAVSDPRVLPKAISEGLRWMSPLYGGASRTAGRDLVLGGKHIKAGEHIWLIYGSANTDETEFENPLTYDFDRPQHPNLAFGIGRHSCVGSAYAPQVARIALEELFRVAPNIRLDPDRPPNATGWMFRGARELHAVWK